MNTKEIIHQLQCFDLIAIDCRAHISAQKSMLRRVYSEVFRYSDSDFEKEYDNLYSQKWKECYCGIPVEKRHRLLTDFYEEIFET